MACGLLTKGRGLDCNRISGGIKNIYFAVYDQVTSIPQTAGEITDLEMGTNDLYKRTTTKSWGCPEQQASGTLRKRTERSPERYGTLSTVDYPTLSPHLLRSPQN